MQCSYKRYPEYTHYFYIYMYIVYIKYKASEFSRQHKMLNILETPEIVKYTINRKFYITRKHAHDIIFFNNI